MRGSLAELRAGHGRGKQCAAFEEEEGEGKRLRIIDSAAGDWQRERERGLLRTASAGVGNFAELRGGAKPTELQIGRAHV